MQINSNQKFAIWFVLLAVYGTWILGLGLLVLGVISLFFGGR